MSDDDKTEHKVDEREVSTWCGECMTYQPHTETLFDHGGKAWKCHVCHTERYTGKRQGAADNPQLELFG